MEITSLQNENGKWKRYKEEERMLPQALADLQALQNVQHEFPSQKNEEIRLTCHISESGAWRKPSIARHKQRRRKGSVVGVVGRSPDIARW